MAGATTITAIDADGHILERQSDILKYLEGRWKGRDTGLWPGCQPWDSSLGDTLGHPYGYRGNLSAPDQVKLWHRIMDENEIEQAVLFPTGSGNVASLQETDFAIAVAKAVNDHFAADYAGKRLKPMGVLPMRNAQAAAEELRRAARLGFIGFEILTTGLPFALGDPYYDPVFKTAEELGVTLCVHGTRHWSHQWGSSLLSTFSEVHSYAFVAGILLHFTSVMAQGVPLRYPKLHLAFMEVGATWLPYYLDRLDEHWEKRGSSEMPLLKEKPSDVFRKSTIKVSVEAGETLLRETIAMVGADHMVFATDVPHWDCEFPGNLRHLRAHPELSDVEKEQILYRNAKQLFHL
ncbi:MAG TPA: amidohydrolase family protein [Candidatus Binatia bacterium]|nr:amidohydrolase family protein [Candidatus Binatia bacterium]